MGVHVYPPAMGHGRGCAREFMRVRPLACVVERGGNAGVGVQAIGKC